MSPSEAVTIFIRAAVTTHERPPCQAYWQALILGVFEEGHQILTFDSSLPLLHQRHLILPQLHVVLEDAKACGRKVNGRVLGDRGPQHWGEIIIQGKMGYSGGLATLGSPVQLQITPHSLSVTKLEKLIGSPSYTQMESLVWAVVGALS